MQRGFGSDKLSIIMVGLDIQKSFLNMLDTALDFAKTVVVPFLERKLSVLQLKDKRKTSAPSYVNNNG